MGEIEWSLGTWGRAAVRFGGRVMWWLSVGCLVLCVNGCTQSASPSGEVLYQRHCASCHGAGGKGDGPLAATLRRPPSDLTTLARRSGGRFDERKVIAVIDGEQLVSEHGPREMPVWGVVFDQDLHDQPHAAYTVLLKARVLSDYLRSIQQP